MIESCAEELYIGDIQSSILIILVYWKPMKGYLRHLTRNTLRLFNQLEQLR